MRLLVFVTIVSLSTAALAQPLEVTARALNVRKGPGSGHRVVKVAPKAAILLPAGRTQGNWIKVGYDGVSGWVYADFVKEAPLVFRGSGARERARPNRVKTGRPTLRVVRVKGLKVRAGPGKRFEVLGRLAKGSWVRVIGRRGDWRRVRGSGQAGWVQAGNLGQAGQTRGKNTRESPAPGAVFGRAGEVAGGQQTLNLIKRFEGYRSGAYWDVNAYRVGYGSDTYQTADGKIHRVRQGTVIARADAERDIRRRAAEFQNRIRQQVGARAFNRLPGNVQAALTSVAYNYGSLPSSVVRAVGSGGIGQIANAVEALSANKNRRRQEAAVIRGGA